MDVDDYLRDQSDDGVAAGRGAFTLAPDKARKKLAQSVPAVFTSPWAGVAFLRQGLRLWQDQVAPGGEGSPARLDLARELLALSPECTLQLSCSLSSGSQSGPALEELKTLLEESSSRPFSSTDPVAVCLSRGFVILAHSDLGAVIRFGVPGVGDLLVGGDEVNPVSPKLLEAVGPADAGEVIMIFSLTTAWFNPPNSRYSEMTGPVEGYHQLIGDSVESFGLGRCVEAFRQRAVNREVSAFGIPFKPDSVWTRCPSRETTRLCFDYENAANWFDYRAGKVILLEYLVPSQQASPLLVARDAANEVSGQGVEQIGEQQSAWQRMMTNSEDLVLRLWSAPPQWGESSSLFCRGIFSVALTDAPSRVMFCNWGDTPETTPLPELPPGLAACVWWPELRQSLYGDSWVRDEAYQQALQWTMEQGTAAFSVLRHNFKPVWNFLETHHVSADSREEVRAKVKGWLLH